MTWLSRFLMQAFRDCAAKTWVTRASFQQPPACSNEGSWDGRGEGGHPSRIFHPSSGATTWKARAVEVQVRKNDGKLLQ